MIACRSLFRVDSALKLVNSYVKSKPVNYSQEPYSYFTLTFNKRMSEAKHRLGAMDQTKKRRTATQLWKPVSSQASSIEAHSINDVTVESEDGDQVQEVEVTKSSSIAVEHNVEDKGLQGEAGLATENYSLSVEVGASLFRFIKGKGGATQKDIEEKMGVKIIFPSSKKKESITIEGTSIDSVTRASEKIQAIIDQAVKSPMLDYSHFISLPLAIHPELVDKLVNFQNSILGTSDTSIRETEESDSNEDSSDNEYKDKELNTRHDVAVEFKVEDDDCVKVDMTNIPIVSYAPKASKATTASKSPTLSDLGIDKSIFIKPKTFHLTVLMLKLWNKEQVNAASEVLKSLSSKVMDALDNRPVSIRLKGLDCMRGSLSKARVLYATVEETDCKDRLLRACQVITHAFVEAGLVQEKDAKQKLKLHATVMNARHRKGKLRRKNDSFDARGIFKQFGSEDWGEYLIPEVHLSQRFVFDENGYYHCCASIPLPKSMQVD